MKISESGETMIAATESQIFKIDLLNNRINELNIQV